MKLKEEKLKIDQEIELVLVQMAQTDILDEKYTKLCDRLEYLTSLEKKIKPRKSVSPDTVALIAANLTGIMLVLFWEERHVIASRAFGLITKLRI